MYEDLRKSWTHRLDPLYLKPAIPIYNSKIPDTEEDEQKEDKMSIIKRDLVNIVNFYKLVCWSVQPDFETLMLALYCSCGDTQNTDFIQISSSKENNMAVHKKLVLQ